MDLEDKKLSDEEIKKEEIECTIMQLNNGKSPVRDGIPNEFYKHFKEVLAPILKEVYDEVFKREETSNFIVFSLLTKNKDINQTN